jgi:uncharacterized protein YjbI with pentapeptide repeats
MFSFTFRDCYLDFTTFYGTKLKKTLFQDCSLKEVDFSEVDLSGSSFNNSDLFGARFFNTVLEKVDFTTARNFSIDMDVNKMKRAKFSALNLAGLLQKYGLDVNYDL